MCGFLLGVFCALMVVAQATIPLVTQGMTDNMVEETKVDIQPFAVIGCESGKGMSSFKEKYDKVKAHTEGAEMKSRENCADLCRDALGHCAHALFPQDRSDPCTESYNKVKAHTDESSEDCADICKTAVSTCLFPLTGEDSCSIEIARTCGKVEVNTGETEITEGIKSKEDCAKLCIAAETTCLGFDYSHRGGESGESGSEESSEESYEESTMNARLRRHGKSRHGKSKSCWLISDPGKLKIQDADEDTTFYVRSGCVVEKMVQEHKISTKLDSYVAVKYDEKLSHSTAYAVPVEEFQPTVDDCGESGPAMDSFESKIKVWKAHISEPIPSAELTSTESCAALCTAEGENCGGFDYFEVFGRKACFLISKLYMSMPEEQTL